MIRNNRILSFSWILLAGILFQQCAVNEMDDPRVSRGMLLLESTMFEAGLGEVIELDVGIGLDLDIDIELDMDIVSLLDIEQGTVNGEAFQVGLKDNVLKIRGNGPAGILYGSHEAVKYLRDLNPAEISGFELSDAPSMNLRGVGLLLMKLGTYNYPVTPEEFPFFYDKAQWIEYLDFLEANRYNYIAFWNGHPFSYFVDLPKYPEAQDGMPKGLLEENMKQLQWLIGEAGQRNIRIIFEFYNIHTSVYFQEHHNLPDEIREPTEQLAEYTAYSIEQFCREYPQVGLYITAGEALDLEYTDTWVNDVIMPAIKSSGSKAPVLLRSWFLDLEHAEKITSMHPEIYIERKFNVEMIVGTEIDPENKTWDELTGRSIVNIHMAANLEPFRWTPPVYIQKCMINSNAAGADGLHLYPRKSWRWPYGCDLGDQSLQWERDRLWYEMWGRYAWNPQRPVDEEKEYWTENIALNMDAEATLTGEVSELMLEAFELSADALPAIQRLFWAGHDNHTVVTAGLLIAQMENAEGVPFLPLDPVISPRDYFGNSDDLSGSFQEFSGRITPVDVLKEKISELDLALEKIDEAITLNPEASALIQSYRQDIQAMLLTTRFYLEKTQAVKFRNEFLDNSDQTRSRKLFLESLENSVEIFRELAELTEGTYESLSDVPAITPVKLEKCPYHWNDLLPLYEKELEIYRELMKEIGGKDFNLPVFDGLAGIWYGDPGLKKPKSRFPTESIDYNWATDGDKPEGGRNWSVHWFGYLEGPTDGEVRFIADADQSVQVRIDGEKIIDDSAEGVFTMKKGELYPIEVVYDHAGAVAGHINLKWDAAGPVLIDGKYFKHSKADVFRVDRMLIQPEKQFEN